MTSTPARPLPLSRRASEAQSSAIRDLLIHAKRPGMISLAGGLPDAGHFPTRELAAIAERAIAEDGEHVLQYGLTQGDERARRALASLFGVSLFGASVDPDRVVVTTGSQQALDLIARVVVDPGDQIVVGDPDYLGALQVFRAHGADVRPVTIDADGLDTSDLEEQLVSGLRPKCLYLVPNFHNPTGATISSERRAHLDELSQHYGFLVVEDDPYRDLVYDGVAPGEPVGDPELTVWLRSTSKTLAPGLRIGALAGPAWLNDPIVTAKQSIDLHTSSLSQAVVASALGAAWFPAHLQKLRAVYRAKRDVLVAALAESFGDSVELATPAGGMFVWARFGEVNDTTAWLNSCLEAGVCFVPGAAFSVERNLSSHARLSFATGSPEELSEGVRRMAGAAAV